jgi:threonyl-tRNA synthetase
MIHRAILGSLERFMAIITENTGGKWPFWLAPNQIVVIPITTKSKELNEYTEKVVEACRAAGLRAENDLGDDTLKKKVRTAVTVKKTPIVFVVGADEQENNAVNVRNRDDEGSQERGEVLPLATVIAQLVELQKTRVPIIPAFSQK